MSLSVNTNAGAFTALQNLNQTTAELGATQSRINTGLKVASAKDSGSIYAIAQTLRGDVAGFNAVNGSLDRARSEVDIAIAGAEAISDLLIQAREKAVAAKDDGLDDDSRNSLDSDFQQLLAQIDSIATNATFNGKNLLTGDRVTALTSADGSTSISASITSLTGSSLSIAGTSIASSTPTANTAVTAGFGSPFSSGDTLNALNNYMDANFNALYNNGALYDQSTGDFTNSNGADSADQTAFALGTALGVSPGVLSSSGNFIYLDSGSLYIEGSGASATFTASATSSSGGDADAAVTAIDAAIDTVNTQLSTLGSTSNRLEIQQGFTGQLSDSIEVGIGNLVDANLAKEAATLQSLQSKQQLGLQALSIANQAPGTVLSLFR